MGRRRPVSPLSRVEPLQPSPYRRCQWLEGEPRDRRFCGRPTVRDPGGRRSSWCAEHYDRCHDLETPKGLLP